MGIILALSDEFHVRERELCLHLFKSNTMIAFTTFLGMIGGQQIILILIIVLLLFGGRKIPELMRGLGSGIKEFKNATKEEEDDTKKEE